MSTLLVSTGIGWLNTLCDTLLRVINPILVVVCVAGIVYAIWVGIQFVKADEKGERDEARQKLIYVIVGIVVTLLLIGLFYFLANNIGTGKLIDPSNLF